MKWVSIVFLGVIMNMALDAAPLGRAGIFFRTRKRVRRHPSNVNNDPYGPHNHSLVAVRPCFHGGRAAN